MAHTPPALFYVVPVGVDVLLDYAQEERVLRLLVRQAQGAEVVAERPGHPHGHGDVAEPAGRPVWFLWNSNVMAVSIEVQGIRLLVQNCTCVRICISVTDAAGGTARAGGPWGVGRTSSGERWNVPQSRPAYHGGIEGAAHSHAEAHGGRQSNSRNAWGFQVLLRRWISARWKR